MLNIIAVIGVPSVIPLNIPDNISTLSFSSLDVVKLLVPGLLLFNSFWISSFDRLSPAGKPSIVAPKAFPWLNPNVVTLNISPVVFATIVYSPILIYSIFI